MALCSTIKSVLKENPRHFRTTQKVRKIVNLNQVRRSVRPLENLNAQMTRNSKKSK